MLWKTKEDERKRLVYRTVYHCLYLAYSTFIGFYGLKVLLSITDDDKKKSIHVDTFVEYFVWFGTQWNMIYQSIYFNLSLMYDVLEWRGKHLDNLGQKLKQIKDVHFNGITVPTTFIVFTFFWLVYAYDRELVFSKDLEPHVPGWLNHCCHTLIVPILIIEAILEPRLTPTNMMLELCLDAASAIFFFGSFYIIYLTTGRWLYALFGTFNWYQLTLFQILIFLLYYVYYLMQFPFSRWVHGDTKEREDVTEAKLETKYNTLSKNNGSEMSITGSDIAK